MIIAPAKHDAPNEAPDPGRSTSAVDIAITTRFA